METNWLQTKTWLPFELEQMPSQWGHRASKHPQPGSPFWVLLHQEQQTQKPQTGLCTVSVCCCHSSVSADGVHRVGMCGVGSGCRMGWIVSKGYYLKKTLLYAWANMVNCIQLAQGKVRHILKQRKAISGRCIQFREIYYPQRNVRKKILIYFISAYST